MKLLRYGPRGQEKPGLLDAEGHVRDLSGTVGDLAGDVLRPASLDRLRAIDPSTLPLIEDRPRIGPCVGRVGKLVCIGLNYSDHAAEAGMPIPKEPVVFTKTSTCICGANDDTITPRESTKLDYEIELGIVIGKRARYLAKEKAKDAIAGYFLANDVSERDFQVHRSGQWVKGKSCETFGPIGPWFVSKDEIRHPQNLDMWLDVNGEKRQRGNTRTMVFDVAHLVWYCSQFFVLEPGDVIATGTPPGVAYGMKPVQQWLKAGDLVELGIEGLGVHRQRIVPFKM